MAKKHKVEVNIVIIAPEAWPILVFIHEQGGGWSSWIENVFIPVFNS